MKLPTRLRRPTAGVRTPKQRAGDQAEQAAERHLVSHGCTIIARNARYREGELDLVARERDVLVFVEVRMRSGSAYGGAAASLDRFKQRRLASAGPRAASMSSRWIGMAQSTGSIAIRVCLSSMLVRRCTARSA